MKAPGNRARGTPGTEISQDRRGGIGVVEVEGDKRAVKNQKDERGKERGGRTKISLKQTRQKPKSRKTIQGEGEARLATERILRID